ncbi:MAG TPA: hypothetical protein PLH94_01460 [Fimbriimonadaceae bacterium]|nr:hypothetical protein [Fimbriimonadaceae bacterium]
MKLLFTVMIGALSAHMVFAGIVNVSTESGSDDRMAPSICRITVGGTNVVRVAYLEGCSGGVLSGTNIRIKDINQSTGAIVATVQMASGTYGAPRISRDGQGIAYWKLRTIGGSTVAVPHFRSLSLSGLSMGSEEYPSDQGYARNQSNGTIYTGASTDITVDNNWPPAITDGTSPTLVWEDRFSEAAGELGAYTPLVKWVPGGSIDDVDDSHGCVSPGISDEGTYLVYANGGQIYRATSWSLPGTQVSYNGNGTSAYPAISGSGQYVVFESTSSNFSGVAHDVADVYWWDANSATTVNLAYATGSGPAYSTAIRASISPDGGFIGFDSTWFNWTTTDIFWPTNDVAPYAFRVERGSTSTRRMLSHGNQATDDGYVAANGARVSMEDGGYAAWDTSDGSYASRTGRDILLRLP